MCEEQTAWWPVRFGTRRLSVWNEKTGDNRNAPCVLSEIDGGRCQLAVTQSHRCRRSLPGFY